MKFLRRDKPRIRGVIDVRSDAIKALLFEVNPNISGGVRENGEGVPRPRPIEKFVWDLPSECTSMRLVQKIREGVFAMVRRMERMPERIVVAIGPTVAEYVANIWRVAPGEGGRVLTRRDLSNYYERLFQENSDLRRAAITAPVELLVNGYTLAWQENWFSEEILPRAEVKEIAFRTLSLYMPSESGAMFAEIKRSLGGMPIEFIPLALAEKEAVVSALGVGDAFIVDVGGAESSFIAVKRGRFAHAAFIPLGARRVLEAGNGNRDRAVTEWKELFRKALYTFYTSGPLPSDVLLAGGGAHIPELRLVLAASDWLGEFSHTSTPSMRVLEGASFFGGDSLAGHLAGPEDVGLAALMIYSLGHKPLF